MLKKIAILLLLPLLLLLIYAFVAFPRPDLSVQVVGQDHCARYGIQFDSRSFERVYTAPQDILQDADTFRAQDRATSLLAEHRQRVNDPFDEADWIKKLEGIAKLSQQGRERQLPFTMYKRFIETRQSFCQQVAPWVLSHLPQGTNISATIYLTALEHPAPAYAHSREIVISLSHPLFVGASTLHLDTGLSTIYNILAHELFHIGYWEDFGVSTEEHRQNEVVIDMLIALQNEGLATYVSYLLTENYPAPFEWSYYFVDSEVVVRRYIGQLNELLEIAETKPVGTAYEDIYRRIGSFGYRRNGFYIVGAYLAKTIEAQLGREALIQTVGSGGFYSFVRVYNSIAEEGMKLEGFSIPQD